MDNDNTINGSVIVASHAFEVNGDFNVRSGPVKPLLDYFRGRTEYFFLIAQPPPHVKGSLAPFLNVYQKGRLIEKIVLSRFAFLYSIPELDRKNRTYLRLKLRDLAAVLYFAFILRKKYSKKTTFSYYFGIESVNAIAGVFIKPFLKIRRIVYYIFDWSVQWFKNSFFNQCYLFFDRFACYHVDCVWNIASAIQEARQTILKYDPKKMAPEVTVPYGMAFRQDLVNCELSGELKKVVYAGYLSEENGAGILPDIAHEAGILDSSIRFTVIGDGPSCEAMKKKCIMLGVNNIDFRGSFDSQDEIDRLLVDSHVAIAPYKEERYSKKKFGDVIKIRNYFACGLPVITTRVVPVAKEIDEESLGIVVEYNSKEFARACVYLLRDKKFYHQTRSAVIEKAKHHHWDSIYSAALKKFS